MKRKRVLQRLLNVRSDEWKVVTRLFWLQFFQGTGIAFFFTASFTKFLEKFPASELALVMIVSAPLLFATGWLFNKYEHKLSLTKLGTITIVLMSLTIFLFQIGGIWLEQDWFYYVMFAWYYVLYLASSLSFWGITSTIFDVRQSKRLFAVISAGDVPAKFIGYTIAYFFVKAVGPLNMLWPAFFMMLGSLPFLYEISRLGVIHHHHHHHDHHEERVTESASGNKIWNIIKRFTLSTLIRRIAILTFLISTCLAIITYEFYTEVKGNHHDDKQLSSFIILFMAGSQVIAMMVKLILTGRIVTSLGVKKSLLITPIVLFILVSFVVIVDTTMTGHKLIFYAFGVAAIAIEVLKTALNNPVFLTVMQPLNLTERSKAHAIVKGIMDPFGYLFTGILLITIAYFFKEKSFLIICYTLLFFTVSWIISIFMVDNSYRLTLLKAISSRFFSQDDFKLSDEEIQKNIKKKIESGNELEVINILKMLTSQISSDSKQLIFELLDHPSDNVKLETILLIKNRNLEGAEEKLYSLANHSTNKKIKYHAVETLCKDEGNQQYQKHFSNHPDPEIRSAAISGMLICPSAKIRKQAEIMLTGLLQSDYTDNKLLAISIQEKVKDFYTHPDFDKLFNEGDEIKKVAFRAIGKSAQTDLLNTAVMLIKEHPTLVMDSLQAAGDNAVPVIFAFLETQKDNRYLKEKMIALLGKIGGETAQQALFNLLKIKPRDSDLIVKALYRSRYVCTPETQKLLESIASEYLVYGIELLYMQKLIESRNEDYEIIFSSLNIELTEIRNVLLCLFGCLYGHERAFRIRQGMDMKKKEAIANAMELIETTVRKELAKPFNSLFEPGDVDTRYAELKNLVPESAVDHAAEIFSHILFELPITYTTWTKACSLYVSKKINVNLQPELVDKYKHSENQLLKETAEFAQ